MKRILSILLALLVCIAPFAALSEGEEAFSMNRYVIDDEANEAGITFLALPDAPEFAVQHKNASDHGFTFKPDWARKEGSYSSPVAGMINQLPAPGSGFTFSLNTTAGADGALRPAIGAAAMFTLTPAEDNLGAAKFAALSAACADLETFEGGWVLPDPPTFADLGIAIYSLIDGDAVDVTARTSIGLNVLEPDKILIYYGAVFVDQIIEDIALEGYPLFVADEEELIWNDGALDGRISVTMWVGVV